MNLPAFLPCAVIGQPIAHSLSPRLHSAFAKQFNRHLDYQRIEASAEQFAERIEHFFASGGRGLNITLPHKVAAFELAQVRHPRAQWAGAANTLWMQDGQLHADNSDGAGLLRDLARLTISVRNKTIAIIGAGGAAAGIVPLLLNENVHAIRLINRSHDRANALAIRFNDARVRVDDDAVADLIISTVSEGFNDLISLCRHSNESVIYDLNYGARAQASKQWATSQQHVWHDGLGMLIEQAAISFEIWHGVAPDTTTLHQGAF